MKFQSCSGFNIGLNCLVLGWKEWSATKTLALQELWLIPPGKPWAAHLFRIVEAFQLLIQLRFLVNCWFALNTLSFPFLTTTTTKLMTMASLIRPHVRKKKSLSLCVQLFQLTLGTLNIWRMLYSLTCIHSPSPASFFDILFDRNCIWICICLFVFVYLYLHVLHPGTLSLGSLYPGLLKK